MQKQWRFWFGMKQSWGEHKQALFPGIWWRVPVEKSLCDHDKVLYFILFYFTLIDFHFTLEDVTVFTNFWFKNVLAI